VGTLYSFCASKVVCADGVFPEGELIQGTDGALYGTTFLGGTHDGGTVFKITLSGDFTSLYSFCSKSPNCVDGTNPSAGLVEANNGLFYGTTSRGGAGSCAGNVQGCGTLFRINSSGSSFTTLYNFCMQPNCADGSHPETSLIQAADGKIYGTTGAGGLMEGTCTEGCGIAFNISKAGGPLTVLHAFSSSEGVQVQNLIQATDGSFYGTALSGGQLSNQGTLFKMDSATGAVTVLFNFCNVQSCQRTSGPSGVLQATNGLLYGTTFGVANGAVFTFGFPPFVKLSPAFGPIGTTINIYGSDLSGATGVTFNGVPATFTIVSSGEIAASVPAGAAGSSVVTVATPSATLAGDVKFLVTQ
jgi:uncharacterized repeat protein (TIGR03803 family)